ncbi:hypothetical protein [Salinicola socius]|nr:hypothetical protein [Salinicola socius]
MIAPDTVSPPGAMPLPGPIAPLVPHARGMCLLDRLIDAHVDGATAEIVTRRDDLFAEADGIPAWIGIEWLAQTVAAWAGFRAAATQEPPPPGLLLGARRYRAREPVFAFDQRIRVVVTIDFVADNGVTQINGELQVAENEASTALAGSEAPLAHGSLTLYRPDSMPISNRV